MSIETSDAARELAEQLWKDDALCRERWLGWIQAAFDRVRAETKEEDAKICEQEKPTCTANDYCHTRDAAAIRASKGAKL